MTDRDKLAEAGLDKVANGTVLLYSIERAKGASEHEAVFNAARKTLGIFYQELANRIQQAGGPL